MLTANVFAIVPLAALSVALVAAGQFGAPFDLLPPIPRIALFAIVWLAPVGAQVYCYRHVSGPVQRQQTKWVVFGVAVLVLVLVLFAGLGTLFPALTQAGVLYQLADTTRQTLTFLLIPLAIGFAILRYRLWDIDVLINRALVYSALTVCVVALYVLVVSGLGALLHGGDLLVSLVATGLVALLFQPLRERLQRGANRLLFGQRDEPYAVLSRLGRRLEGTLAPEAVLPTVVQTVREALKLPYAAIALRQDGTFTVAAVSGIPFPAPLRLPLVYQQEEVGELLLRRPPPTG